MTQTNTDGSSFANHGDLKISLINSEQSLSKNNNISSNPNQITIVNNYNINNFNLNGAND